MASRPTEAAHEGADPLEGRDAALIAAEPGQQQAGPDRGVREAAGVDAVRVAAERLPRTLGTGCGSARRRRRGRQAHGSVHGVEQVLGRRVPQGAVQVPAGHDAGRGAPLGRGEGTGLIAPHALGPDEISPAAQPCADRVQIRDRPALRPKGVKPAQERGQFGPDQGLDHGAHATLVDCRVEP